MSDIPHNSKELKAILSIDFTEWYESQSLYLQKIVAARIERIKIGHFGDHKRFEGVIEFRWMNGIRMYGFLLHQKLIILLVGGNKHGQSKDIKKAIKIKKEYINGKRTIEK